MARRRSVGVVGDGGTRPSGWGALPDRGYSAARRSNSVPTRAPSPLRRVARCAFVDWRGACTFGSTRISRVGQEVRAEAVSRTCGLRGGRSPSADKQTQVRDDDANREEHLYEPVVAVRVNTASEVMVDEAVRVGTLSGMAPE